MRRSKRTPEVEGLEGRRLLTGHPGMEAPAEVAPVGRALAVSGRISGTYRAERPTNPDAGIAHALSGAGSVAPMGRVRLTGLIRTGAAGQPPDRGTLVLGTRRGSVVLSVEGPLPTLRDDGSILLSASIVGGSGRFATLRGLGTARLVLGPNGRFGLELSLQPPRR